MMAYDIRYSPNKWPGEEIKPGFGGVWPGDPNAETFHVRPMALSMFLRAAHDGSRLGVHEPRVAMDMSAANSL